MEKYFKVLAKTGPFSSAIFIRKYDLESRSSVEILRDILNIEPRIREIFRFSNSLRYKRLNLSHISNLDNIDIGTGLYIGMKSVAGEIRAFKYILTWRIPEYDSEIVKIERIEINGN